MWPYAETQNLEVKHPSNLGVSPPVIFVFATIVSNAEATGDRRI